MLDIENIVYSRIQYSIPQKIKDKYPDLNFTTDNRELTSPKFPCVYVHLMPSVEVGQDLEGISINGGRFTFQIEVYDNQSQNRAKTIMSEIVGIMKKMCFELNAFPEFQNTTDIYRSVARFRRVIGAGDIL